MVSYSFFDIWCIGHGLDRSWPEWYPVGGILQARPGFLMWPFWLFGTFVLAGSVYGRFVRNVAEPFMVMGLFALVGDGSLRGGS